MTHRDLSSTQPLIRAAALWTKLRETRRLFPLLVTVLIALIALSITLGIMIGPVPIEPLQVWRIALHKVGIAVGDVDWARSQENIVWIIRFPRVLLAAVVGAGLAVIGAVMQALTRNPLADPFLLGISSGASVGAVLVILMGVFTSFGLYALATGAFLGAMAAFALVYVLAQQGGRISPLRMVLAGVAVSYLFSAATSFITLRAGDAEATRRVLFWLLGGFAGTQWEQLGLPVVLLVTGSVYLLLHARALNAMSVGEETAVTLGFDVHGLRRRLLVVTSLLTGVMVAVSGVIGFVGLILPHMIRQIVGADHHRLLPISALAGAVFLVWVDMIARTVFAPEELPVGIITALLGAPFFILLMIRSTRRKGAAL